VVARENDLAEDCRFRGVFAFDEHDRMK
jgi:hypothetical protein